MKIVMCLLLVSSLGLAQTLPRPFAPPQLRNFRALPQPRFIQPLPFAPTRRAAPSSWANIVPANRTGESTNRPGTAAQLAEQALVCKCNAKPDTREISRVIQSGTKIVEHAETQCPACGAAVGVSRSLRINGGILDPAPQIQTYLPGTPRPSATTEEGQIANQVRKSLPNPPLVRVFDTSTPRRTSQRLAEKGLSAMCPRSGGTCPRKESLFPLGYQRGAKIKVRDQEYDASSARCSITGCGATAEGVYGVKDGSQAISARRKGQFLELRGKPQVDQTAAEMAREAAQRKREGRGK